MENKNCSDRSKICLQGYYMEDMRKFQKDFELLRRNCLYKFKVFLLILGGFKGGKYGVGMLS